MYLPISQRGRLAKMMSFLVKHSSTVDGEDMITTGLDPKRREKIGPYFLERFCNCPWIGGLRRRWRWPRIGIAGGLGGRWGCILLLWRKILKANERKRRHRDVLSHVISMVVLMTNIRERWVQIWRLLRVLIKPKFVYDVSLLRCSRLLTCKKASVVLFRFREPWNYILLICTNYKNEESQFSLFYLHFFFFFLFG